MGDMAVSNSIGSNVFDILVGLGLPWALKTLAINYGSDVSAPPSLLVHLSSKHSPQILSSLSVQFSCIYKASIAIQTVSRGFTKLGLKAPELV